jgi:hypothetical protein
MESPCIRFLLKVFNQRSWTYTVIPSKFWTRHEKQTSWIYRVIPSNSFETDMKYWQVEHKGWLHPNVDWIRPYVQLVSTSSLVHNFWMESPCMFNLSVLHDWLNIFGFNHTVCSICQYLYRVIQSKIVDPDMK